MKLLLLLLPLVANAQVQVLVQSDNDFAPLGASYNVGAAEAGNFLDIRFRFVNTGSVGAVVNKLAIGGTGFSIRNPATPINLPVASSADVIVRFQPPNSGSYSATFTVNSFTTILRGTGIGIPALQVEQSGTVRALNPGDTVQFGSVERGKSLSLLFHVRNTNTNPVSVESLIAGGGDFSLTSGLPGLPLLLEAGKSADFTVTFQPSAAGVSLGSLSLNGRVYPLAGSGVELPLPSASLAIEESAVASASQIHIRVQFGEPARGEASGTLIVSFAPQQSLPDDAFIQFSNAKRTVPFTVRPGEDFARFGSDPNIVLQTGSSAGVITLRGRTNSGDTTLDIPIAGQPIAFDETTGAREGSTLTLSVTGYDNTRAGGSMNFQFFDRAGNAIPNGKVTADFSEAFSNYFRGNNSGGMFRMKATFPVAGDATLVGSVQVEAANAVGRTTLQRIPFP